MLYRSRKFQKYLGEEWHLVVQSCYIMLYPTLSYSSFAPSWYFLAFPRQMLPSRTLLVDFLWFLAKSDAKSCQVHLCNMPGCTKLTSSDIQTCVEHVWNMCGTCVEHVWNMCGTYVVIDLKVLVRSFNCESRACYVGIGNPRESFFFRVRESNIFFRESFAEVGYQ